ncbi:hypothetical protein PCE1_000496 [Barthelona sp. PCE]
MDDEIHDAFVLCDSNRDNLLDLKDATEALRCLGIPVTYTDVKQHTPPTPNLELNFDDFKALVDKLSAYAAEKLPQDIMMAFRAIDRDKDGMISASELYMMLTTLKNPLSEEQVDQLFAIGGVDRDSNISYDKFCNMFTII